MSRKGEKIYRRKDGRWEGRFMKGYHADGKAKYGYVYGRTYSEVKQKRMDDRAAHQLSCFKWQSRWNGRACSKDCV